MKPNMMQNLISSGILLFCWILVKVVIHNTLSHWKFKAPEDKLRWVVRFRNFMFLALLLGLMLIWISALKTFAVSIVVIASAIAIAAKEYFMCLFGGMFKAGSDHFTIGDRITMGGYRGDVINHTLTTTTLLEIGPVPDIHQYTGHRIVLPNSILLTSPVVNETQGDRYCLHVFKVQVPRSDDWHAVMNRLQKACEEVCAEWMGNAQAFFNYQGRKRDFDPPEATPKIVVRFSEKDCVEFVVRVPVLTKEVGNIQQSILLKTFDSRST